MSTMKCNDQGQAHYVYFTLLLFALGAIAPREEWLKVWTKRKNEKSLLARVESLDARAVDRANGDFQEVATDCRPCQYGICSPRRSAHVTTVAVATSVFALARFVAARHVLATLPSHSNKFLDFKVRRSGSTLRLVRPIPVDWCLFVSPRRALHEYADRVDGLHTCTFRLGFAATHGSAKKKQSSLPFFARDDAM